MDIPPTAPPTSIAGRRQKRSPPGGRASESPAWGRGYKPCRERGYRGISCDVSVASPTIAARCYTSSSASSKLQYPARVRCDLRGSDNDLKARIDREPPPNPVKRRLPCQGCLAPGHAVGPWHAITLNRVELFPGAALDWESYQAAATAWHKGATSICLRPHPLQCTPMVGMLRRSWRKASDTSQASRDFSSIAGW